jgi:hypothetical protein
MIKKYYKKPIPVEVVQFTGTLDNSKFLEEWSNGKVSASVGNEGGHAVVIETLEGDMRPRYGDYVVKGSEGEFWFVKKSIFEKTYEEIK